MNFIGLGRDIHKIKRSKTKIVLGGYKFFSKHKIVAVSDGDVILHALSDAILGACQLGDIGIYFNDACVRNRNLDSTKILQKALDLARAKKFQLVNVDLTITCDKIMIAPVRKQITKSLKNLLKTNFVNVKATRFEQNKKIIMVEAAVILKKTK